MSDSEKIDHEVRELEKRLFSVHSYAFTYCECVLYNSNLYTSLHMCTHKLGHMYSITVCICT